MSNAIGQLLKSFDELSQQEQQTVASEILRRASHFDVPSLTDKELVQQAESLFLELDKAENADAKRS